MYTKRQLIEQIYLAVAAGSPTDDIMVEQPDIEKYLVGAINEAVKAELEGRQQKHMQSQRLGIELGSQIGADADLLTSFTYTPQKDEDRDAYYITLSQRIMSLPANAGLHDVFPTKGIQSYVRATSRAQLITSVSYLKETTFYLFERQGDGEHRVYFYNLGEPVCDVVVMMVTDFDSFDDSDVIPIPSGLETAVIDRCVEFFFNERARPEDKVGDNKDKKDNR